MRKIIYAQFVIRNAQSCAHNLHFRSSPTSRTSGVPWSPSKTGRRVPLVADRKRVRLQNRTGLVLPDRTTFFDLLSHILWHRISDPESRSFRQPPSFFSRYDGNLLRFLVASFGISSVPSIFRPINERWQERLSGRVSYVVWRRPSLLVPHRMPSQNHV